MVKEPKNIDFCTTGREPSKEEFALVSEWIKNRKAKTKIRKTRITNGKRKKSPKV